MKRWKAIPNYEGYFISDKGEVGTQWINKGRHGLIRVEEIKTMKCSLSAKKYKMVKLGGRKAKWQSIHRLVYENFKGEIPEGLFVRHLNDNPLDNNVENLELGTQKDNMSDARANGLLGKNGKLDDEEKLEIIKIKNLNPETPNRVIAEKFKVGRKTIDRVIKEYRNKMEEFQYVK